ncbi:histidine kinase dimerization/phosphoacceptor domain -containing protein [Sphingomonas sp. BIUV-7]|uniref:histidine kinase n=1 Tax=Sphingomonas natans TaxID=3063330 RepID=A0ABT8Y600_9SPHN|nr:histidine kinase dimerization/phosphoacceptor domain -containing protein [Sphingomonas sp. BIUV-7]MDO6413753.1 histidine kinase dimerization/phosphoacceptor domain -containing protein [Sphingomonas sp. BIUV-7]
MTACDREPIHVPGAIQPHGLMLLADRETLRVVGGAGDIEGRLTPIWLDRPIEALLAQSLDRYSLDANDAVPLAVVPGRSETFDASLHMSGDLLVVELEPAPTEPRTAVAALAELDRTGAQFERAADLQALCERAATAFRRVTGFDRVMIYRFLDDGAGKVLAEDRDPALHSFLNHHFPEGDIPKQARALYVRTPVRVIPDIDYAPMPIRPAELVDTDLSGVGLRSVSPIHLQYMRNMGVRASASISIVKDGLLWGLVACHHNSPRRLSYETRAICQTMAGELARFIRAKEEAETFRERVRLRSGEDAILAGIEPHLSVDAFFAEYGDDLRQLLGADGFAVIQNRSLSTSGRCPGDDALLRLGEWLLTRTVAEPFVTQRLASIFPAAAADRDIASGVLAVALSGDAPMLLVWIRAEEPTIVEWAGNPHKDVENDPAAILTPRTSFEAWSEEVRGCARRWTRGEVEAAGRLRTQLLELRQSRRLRELNRELTATLAEKDSLIQQKDHLLREVNHRVQNSLQLVQSFLALQARGGEETNLADTLNEAQRRISAVALVHRRLYQADHLESVDLSRYLEELVGEMQAAMGAEWAHRITLNLAPLLISADRAVHVGLILTELVINANKYAYAGQPGPIELTLEQYRNSFRLIVADQGSGKATTGGRQGFGTRMMTAMVSRLGGTIEQFDNRPGLRVIVSAPIDE